MFPSRRAVAAIATIVVLAIACASATTPVPTLPTAPPPASPTIAATPTLPPTAALPTSRPLELLPPINTKPLDVATAAALQKVLDDLVKIGAPDAIASVVTADGQWSGAAGVDGPNGRSAKPGDEFNIASVTKPIVAALVLRLAQDGKLDLDAPLADYLGGLPVDANKATVRQALAMRSGIGDTPEETLTKAREDCGHAWTQTEILRAIPAPHMTAGETFEYSNPTYKLLGYAVEHVTGKPLGTAFQDAMFAPVGADRMLLQGSKRPTPKPWALPIAGSQGLLPLEAYGTGGALPCLSVATLAYAGSGVASDAPSLARWGWGLFSGTLLDRASLTAMTTVDNGGFGLGIERLASFNPDLAYGIHGGQVGYAAFLVVLPERQAVAAVFMNEQEADVEAAARKLIDALGQ